MHGKGLKISVVKNLVSLFVGGFSVFPASWRILENYSKLKRKSITFVKLKFEK